MRIIMMVADELAMPDKRGACVITGMTARQEADFWIPGNDADPCFKANPAAYPNDSMGDDGLSVGGYQQQTSRAGVVPPWGWGGLYGDPEGTRKRMSPYESTKLFLAALKKTPYRATNANEANDFAQRVQQSGVPDGYAKHWSAVNALYDAVSTSGVQAPPPPVANVPYGLPTGSNSGGYGNTGVKFPQWVYDLGNAYGVKPSTYPGHQESDRPEAGYAPNPQHLNRGIDWVGTTDAMQRFADYLFSIKDQCEQVIWWNPQTNKKIGVAGGKDVTDTPYFNYPGGFDDHRDHVHLRTSHSIAVGGGFSTVPTTVALKPIFTELDYYSGKKVGQGFSVRSRTAINFFIHTEEGNGTAKSLADFCDGSNGVSYHYTLRDGILCDVVDTDYYSWSVLNANVFSINLCFAGSYAGWTRAQWLQREKDIEIAAFVAVQDCRKYGIPTDVIAPPYHQAAGISDHKYVTQQLGIGTHTDVGMQFPWDVFTMYVNKYANDQTGDDFLMALSDAEQREVLASARRANAVEESLSPIRPLENPGKGDLKQLARWTDGSVHFQACLELAKMGHQPTIDLVKQVAGADPKKYPDRQDDAVVCRNIMHQAELFWASLSATSTAVSKPAAEVVSADPDMVRRYADAQGQIAVLQAENRVLQSRLSLQAQAAAAPPMTNLAVNGSAAESTGAKIQKAVDSNMDYTDHVLAMNAAERTALTRALSSIDPVAKEKEEVTS